MTALTRASAASRIFTVAAILGLTLSLGDNQTVRAILVLAAVAGIAVAADLTERLPRQWVVTTEAAFATIVVGSTFPGGALLLPYLVVPGLITGIALGSFAVMVTVGVEVVSLAVVLVASGYQDVLRLFVEYTGPWIATSAGVGLVASRIQHLRAPDTENHASYESARQLLLQLRTVTRRLSSGLDPASLGGDLLLGLHAILADDRGGVFVRTDGGVFAPVAFRGATARESLTADDPGVRLCWETQTLQTEARPHEPPASRHRTVLPLRLSARGIGVVVLEHPVTLSAAEREEVQRVTDEHALRLDTALAFDEIRSMATMEERHRLAREIHDGIAQEIASLGYVVDDLSAGATDEDQRGGLLALRAELTRVVSELRLSIFDLRSELSAGLGSALSDYVREVGSRSGLTVHLTLVDGPTRLPGSVEAELLRIAQEAVTNVRKHAGADNLWVECQIQPPYARIEVRDDGKGLGAGRADSYGLKIMRERSERVGATLDIAPVDSVIGTLGTVVTVTVGAVQGSVG